MIPKTGKGAYALAPCKANHLACSVGADGATPLQLQAITAFEHYGNGRTLRTARQRSTPEG